MKIINFIPVLFTLLIPFTDTLSQQASGTVTVNPGLNNTELLQNLSGLWKSDLGKDQTAAWEVKPFGTGIEATFRIYTGDEITVDGKQLWGYDEETDRVIGAGMFQNTGMQLVTLQFLSATEYVIHFFKDSANPDSARYKVVGILESADTLIETTYDGEVVLKVDTWKKTGL